MINAVKRSTSSIGGYKGVFKSNYEDYGLKITINPNEDSINDSSQPLNKEQLLNSLYYHSKDALLLINKNEIFDFNPAAMDVFRAESTALLKGINISELSTNVQPNGLKSSKVFEFYYNEALEVGYKQFLWSFKRFDKTRFHGEIMLSRIKNNGSTFCLASIRDISRQKEVENALKKSEKELIELNKTKDKLFSIIAHDLKNPMQILMLASDMLLRKGDFLSRSELKKRHFDIYESIASLRELLDNLLNWSQSQTGKLGFCPSKIELNKLAEDNLVLFKMNAESKGIRIKNNIKQGIFAYADENMTDTVLRNLISNAIKFTERNGLIRIEAVEKRKYVEINVIDTGTGIMKEDRSRLFRLDVHHSKKGTADERGTGLGLIICREFAERNGGKISVESALGKGSAFKFTLQRYSGGASET